MAALGVQDPANPNVVLFILPQTPVSAVQGYLDASHPLADVPAYSANLNYLAANSLVFDNAYADIPRSSPSRVSLMTSLLPRRQLGILNDASAFASDVVGRATYLTDYISKATQVTVGTGRVFFTPSDTGKLAGFDDYATSAMGSEDDACAPSEACVLMEAELSDGDVASLSVDFLRSAVQRQTRFALTVGLYRPYGNFSRPSWAVDLVNQSMAELVAKVLADPQMFALPASALQALSPAHMTAAQVAVAKATMWQTLQWVDFSVGRVLDELRGLGLWDNTIVVVASDAGAAEGEFSQQGASALYEHGARVPLFVRDPRFANAMGLRTSARVQLVDLAPSLYSLLALPRPGPIAVGRASLSGKSFSPLLQLVGNAQADAALGGQSASGLSMRFSALTESPRCTPSASAFQGTPVGHEYMGSFTDCAGQPDPGRADVMGLSLRTAQYRYTEWRLTSQGVVLWDAAALVGRELYDHSADPGLVGLAGNKFERVNLAPCASCKLIVGGNPVSSAADADAALPNDLPGADYAPPSLPADAALSALTRALALTLRASGRDGQPPCSDHGLVNPDDGSCAQCDLGWSGPACASPALSQLASPDVTVPTAAPTRFTVAPSRPPVGAPTLPQSSAPPTIVAAGGGGGSSGFCALPLYEQCRQVLRFCVWIKGTGCQPRPTTAPTAQATLEPTITAAPWGGATPPPLQQLRFCTDLATQAQCAGVNGCTWQGTKTGCRVPLPTPCSCSQALDPVYAVIPIQRAWGPQLFRNACHAACKGAELVMPTDSPTVAVPTVPPGEPFPSVPGQGNAHMVNSLDLFVVVDTSQSVDAFDAACAAASKGSSCWQTIADFFDALQQTLVQFVHGGYGDLQDKGFRISVLASSCLVAPIFVLTSSSDAAAVEAGMAALRALPTNGPRCLTPALQQLVQLDASVDPARRPHRAALIAFAGYLSDASFAGAGQAVLTLRERGVATFALVQARQRALVGGPGMTPAEVQTMRDQALVLAGAAERVFNAGPQGWAALPPFANPIAAAMLVTLNEPGRLSALAGGPDVQGQLPALAPGAVAALVFAVLGAAVGLAWVARRRARETADPRHHSAHRRQLAVVPRDAQVPAPPAAALGWAAWWSAHAAAQATGEDLVLGVTGRHAGSGSTSSVSAAAPSSAASTGPAGGLWRDALAARWNARRAWWSSKPQNKDAKVRGEDEGGGSHLVVLPFGTDEEPTATASPARKARRRSQEQVYVDL
jgi:iduronate 2-sulfatase